MRLRLSSIVVAAIYTCIASAAISCPDGYYKEGFTGVCLPKGRTVEKELNPETHVKKVLTLAEAIATGNSDEQEKALGALLTSAPTCGGCMTYKANIAPDIPDAMFHQIVGRGAIVWAGTGSPELVVIDMISNLPKPTSLAPSDEDSQAIPVGRVARVFSAKADCLGRSNDGEIFAAWKDAPALVSSEGSFVFPAVDLLPGDAINVTAPICETFIEKGKGESIASGTFIFQRSRTSAGAPEALKWFLIGPASSISPVPQHTHPAIATATPDMTSNIASPSVEKRTSPSQTSWGIIAAIIGGLIALTTAFAIWRRRPTS